MSSTANSMSASLNDQAYQRLLQMIATGEIRPDDFISHRQLAARLGMSKLPVGMALKRLEEEGLAESVARVGTRICRIDSEEIWGMVNWRLALECQITRLACESMNPEKASRLTAAALRADQFQKKTWKIRFPVDVDFHQLLAEIADCPRLKKELERMNIYRVKVAMCEAIRASAKKPPAPPPDHRRLARTIIAGPPARAEQVMREHLEHAYVLYGFLAWYRQSRHLEELAQRRACDAADKQRRRNA